MKVENVSGSKVELIDPKTKDKIVVYPHNIVKVEDRFINKFTPPCILVHKAPEKDLTEEVKEINNYDESKSTEDLGEPDVSHLEEPKNEQETVEETLEVEETENLDDNTEDYSNSRSSSKRKKKNKNKNKRN